MHLLEERVKIYIITRHPKCGYGQKVCEGESIILQIVGAWCKKKSSGMLLHIYLTKNEELVIQLTCVYSSAITPG